MPDLDNPLSILSESFSAIEFVTNPYALSAFTLVVILMAIGLFVKAQKTRTMLLIIFGLTSLSVPVLQLNAVRTEMLEHTLIHLVREAPPAKLGKKVEISLLDIETLKGKKNWEFNSNLLGAMNVYKRVMETSGFLPNNYPDFDSLDNVSWRKFISDLEDSDDVEEKLKAEKIKDIPFARFRVVINGQERAELSESYYFKGDRLMLDEVSIEIANIYNTKHHSSGEREAANLRIIK